MGEGIYDALKKYKNSNITRMHMPGHKGKAKLCAVQSEADITEITAFDNLHLPKGIILDSMKLASQLWGSRHSFYLVNGSTCGILASVRALTKKGDKVLVARNSHKSVFHAIELCGLLPIFIMPKIVEGWGIFGSVSKEDIRKALEKEKDIRLVIITSPTYEGVISDIKAIADEVHKKEIPLLVDEAHGAHLGFANFKKGAVKCGADVVVQSMHKTLSCPTQTAILHVCSERVSAQEIRHQLSVFETSSPSYIFMAEMDRCVRKLYKNKNAFSKWENALRLFYRESEKLKAIKILGNRYLGTDEIYDYDKSKLVIAPSTDKISSSELFSMLRDKYKIECEMESDSYVLAMTGMGDDETSIKVLLEALFDATNKFDVKKTKAHKFMYAKPQMALSPQEAMEKECEIVSVKSAGGRICGEYVWAYPPGIPILIPGEIISESFCNEELDYLKLKSSTDNLPTGVAVLKN